MLKEVKDKSIEEHGERMIPAYHKGFIVYGEHVTRYESVAHLLKGKVVLDIASGSGYGSYLLAEQAKKVYGVDVDEESVRYAKKNYGRFNIEYLQGNAETIPLGDNSVDVVVTFETIEHVKNYQKFLQEIKRVLKPDGFAIVSTPNDTEFPEGNHFHLHEFKEKELDRLLKQYFKNVEFSYQYTWLFAGLLRKGRAEKEWDEKFDTQNLSLLNSGKALYFMVICSDKPISNLKIRELGALSEHYSARQVKEAEEVAHKLSQEHAALQEEQRMTKADLHQKQVLLDSILSSRGWRLLRILYAIKRTLSAPFRQK